MVFQRKSPTKRPAKSYQTEVPEKKTRTLKRSPLKEESTKTFTETATSYSTDEIYIKIQQRAYDIFQERGFTHGNDLADWLQAEQEVIEQLSDKSNLN